MTRTKPPPSGRLAMAVILAGALACADGPSGQLRRLVPSLSPAIASCLVAGDSALAHCVREAGYEGASNAFHALIRTADAVAQDPAAGDTGEYEDIVVPVVSRLGAAITREYGADYFELEATLFARTYPDQWRPPHPSIPLRTDAISPDVAVARLRAEMRAIDADPILSRGSHLVGMRRYQIAKMLESTGDLRAALREYMAAADDFRAGGHPAMVAQTYGVAGSIHGRLGQTDSMFALWDTARELGLAHRVPMQAGRISGFYARYYADRGRLSLAHTLHGEAIDISKRLDGRTSTVRFLIELMQFYERLGAEDMVAELLPHAEMLERQFPSEPTDMWLTDLRARQLMREGELEWAQRMYARLQAHPFIDGETWLQPAMRYRWADALQYAGRDERALAVASEGKEMAARLHHRGLELDFHLLLARIHLQLGHYESARAALRAFDAAASQDAVDDKRVERELIDCRLHLAVSDDDGITSALEHAVEQLVARVESMTPTSHAYLWLNGFDALRQMLVHHVSDDPNRVYGAELYWNNLYRRFDRRAAPLSAFTCGGGHFGPGCLISRLDALADSARALVQRAGARHLAYAVIDGCLRRIDVAGNTVTVETLDPPVEALREAVTEAWDRLASPRADADPALAELLSSLGADLLPGSLRDLDTGPGRRPLVLVTADNFLASLPFEVLDVSSGPGYDPLLAHADVASLRHPGRTPDGPRASGAVVVAAPELPDRVRRRHQLARLGGAAVEADMAAALLDDVVTIEGEEATRERIVQAWPRAQTIYVAAHVLQSPEVPFLTLMPVAAGPDSPPEEQYIALSDVRALDLRGAELVVLSACATGRPYTGTARQGASLADGFVDAGAGAVVQTCWSVRDDDALAEMGAFLAALSTCPDPVRALNAMKRSRIHGPEGLRHPHHWATYGIELGRIGR